MSRLKGKTAVITGGSSGIGCAIAHAFAAEGAMVIIGYNKNGEGAEHARKDISEAGGHAELIQADISTADGLDTLVSGSRSFAEPDIWVNNAGADILTGELALEQDRVKLQRLVEVDLLGTINACWAIVPVMQERGRGVIINMSWDLAIHGFCGRNPQMFAAVKAGVLGFSKSLALTCGPEVRVNVLAPGWIHTTFAEDLMDGDYYDSRVAEIPLRRFGQAEDVASTAVFLASDDAAYITGQAVNINGGLI